MCAAWPTVADAAPFSIRTFQTGDMGLIASRQAVLYAQTQGWGRGLEANVGQTTVDFLRGFKPGREQGWIAELDGTMAGSILLSDEGAGVSRLRLLYVEPSAQGRGIGAALVDTCLGFARSVGYRALVLWTHAVLTDARRLYASRGFVLVETAMHEAFGVPVQGETWRLELNAP